MDDKHLATRIRHRPHKIANKAIAFVPVNTNAVLDRHWHIHHIHHGLDALGHQGRFVHQTGTEGTPLNTFAGATAVDVDLVITPVLPQSGTVRQISGLAATELQGQRMLFDIETQMARHIPVQQGTGSHHLGIEERMPAQQTVKVTTMSVSPVHHRGHGHAPWVEFSRHVVPLQVAHQGAVLCTSPIHSAQAELAASAAPAIRTPQAPLSGLCPRNLSHNQGAAVIVTLVPSANNAMTKAPSNGPPAIAATSNAEYSKPHGRRAHKTPSTRGAPPDCPPQPRALAHTLRPTDSSHTGCRALTISTSPSNAAAT